MRPTVALGIICHQRPRELRTLLGTLGPGDFEEVLVADMASEPPLDDVDGVRLIRSDRNLGVSGGRNLLVAEATTDIVVFVDDDAVVCSAVADQVREAFAGDDRLALLAFKVTRPDGLRRWEQPFRLGRAVPEHRSPCAYFVGCGHAIRRSAFAQAQGYDERLFYATQELDLSYKLLRDGHGLEYEPAIVVEHRPSERGRAPDANLPGMLLHDRLLVVRSHLPAWAAIPHALAWGLVTLRQALRAGGVPEWRRAAGAGLRSRVERRPLGPRELLQVHRVGGRVFF